MNTATTNDTTTQTMTLNITYTDTFGGEANYSWVRRYSANLSQTASAAQVKRLAKKAAGLAGIRGRWVTFGESFAFYPANSCTVLFVDADYDY